MIPDMGNIKNSNHSKGLIDKRILLLPVYISTLSIRNKPVLSMLLNIAIKINFT